MARYNNKQSMPRIDVVKRIFIVLCSLALVVTFLPRSSKSVYKAELGQPWRGQNVYADFDFDIQKPDSTIRNEQADVRRNFKPYFTFNNTVDGEVIKNIRKTAKAKGWATDDFQVSYCVSRVRKLYSTGLLDSVDCSRYVIRNGSTHINMIRGSEQTVVAIDGLSTYQSAYQLLLDEADSTQQGFILDIQLSKLLKANLKYDSVRSVRELNNALLNIKPIFGTLKEGSIIVSQGQEVTSEIILRLQSYNAELDKQASQTTTSSFALAGQALYALIILVGFCIFLKLFRGNYIFSMRHVLLLAMLVVIMPVFTSLVLRLQLFTVYVIPFAIIPIMARVFTDSRTAAMTMATSVLLSVMALEMPFNFLIVQFVAGLVSIYALNDLSERSQLFRCAIYVTVTALLTLLSLDLIHDGNVGETGWTHYIGIAICGLLLLFTYPLLFVFERLFGFTSNVTLVELSNVNNTLLRRLSEEAPGTFQHCLQVANLAAEVANHVGAKSQLVRTGALYHDIGKLKHSAFFTENQRGINPHDRLTPVNSARVIIEHVAYGLELASKHNLPQVIRDFIATHHGAGKAMYFYIKEREAHPDEEVDMAPFTYPGPNPTTLEQAILMMADAVEAASRSLKEYTDESIAGLVDRIIDGQVANGFFVQCPITFRDIATAKKVFCDKLRTIYHTRISYPTLK